MNDYIDGFKLDGKIKINGDNIYKKKINIEKWGNDTPVAACQGCQGNSNTNIGCHDHGEFIIDKIVVLRIAAARGQLLLLKENVAVQPKLDNSFGAFGGENKCSILYWSITHATTV